MASTDDELTTRRLLLSRPGIADLDMIFKVHSDVLATEHNPGDTIASLAEASELLAAWQSQWVQNGCGYWAVRRREDSTLIGFCGLKLMTLHTRPVLNLFYRLAPLAWNNGYATEAATAAVVWARDRRPDLPVIARVRPDNAASAAVATRAGLTRHTTLDGEGYDGWDLILATGWEP